MRKPVVQPGGRVHIHRTVSDMKRAIDFYVTVLGFHYREGVRDMAWLDHSGMLLTISPGEPALDLGSYFGWAVDTMEELDTFYDKLHRRHQRLSGPPSLADSRPYFFIYDPDDYPIAFSYQPRNE